MVVNGGMVDGDKERVMSFKGRDNGKGVGEVGGSRHTPTFNIFQHTKITAEIFDLMDLQHVSLLKKL